MRRRLDRALKVISIMLLLAMPIVTEIVKNQHTLTANDLDRNWTFMCWLYVYPFISALAIIALLRQKLGARIYAYRVDGLRYSAKLEKFLWILKIGFWMASLVYILYNMMHNDHTWHRNWRYCQEALRFIAPALMIHLAEKVYHWWPVIKAGMSTDHNICVRLLLTGASILFRGIGARPTAIEKVFYSIRTVYYFCLFIGIIFDLHWLFPIVPEIFYDSICESYVVRIGYHYLSLSILRIIELFLVDKRSHPGNPGCDFL